jgi:hypothetical protein
MAKSATSKKAHGMQPGGKAAPFTLAARLAEIEADPVNRIIAAARKLSDAREEAMHAQVACAFAEDELRTAAGDLA